jgi:hypothetical protein
MALQNSGAISFSNIKDEFGLPPNKNLGAYRVSETYGELQSLPLDSGIPKSGQIKFSDFYGKRLNIIVNFWSGSNEARKNARTKYIDNEVNVVGGFISRPNNSSGKRVFIHVNKTISSANSDIRVTTALRTGSWDNETVLSVDVGSNGRILGAGGNGGKGANSIQENGTSGQNANSGLGLEYSGVVVNVSSGAIISCGFGGGGGGGAAQASIGASGGKKGGTASASVQASGGGGGGGAGSPAGSGGDGGTGTNSGSSGSSGSTFSRGAGGAGGSGSVSVTSGGKKGGSTTTVTATGGKGGDGGDTSVNAQSGQTVTTSGGANGSNGAAIIFTESYTLNNAGTIRGVQQSVSNVA